jgi:hypothetical protein
LESRRGEKIEIREGSRGQFDVLADDVLIFSKKETGRFPQAGEVEARYELLKDGKPLPPPPGRKSFLSRLMSRLSN